MANIFNLNFNNIVENLIPWFWRRTFDLNETKLLANSRSIIKPIQDISDSLLLLQQNTNNYLNYNGQHKILEEYLNDNYDNILRRIYITENNIAGIDEIKMYQTGEVNPEPLVFYQTGEVNPVPLAFYQTNEGITDNAFTVNIPVSITYNSIVLTAQLRNYVEATKNFNFVIF